MSQSYIREYGDDGGIYAQAGAEPGIALSELLDHTPLPCRWHWNCRPRWPTSWRLPRKMAWHTEIPKLGSFASALKAWLLSRTFDPEEKQPVPPSPHPLGLYPTSTGSASFSTACSLKHRSAACRKIHRSTMPPFSPRSEPTTWVLPRAKTGLENSASSSNR